ncbi:hypothetical protein LSH36_570g05002 [Paralvinella palmiformis]|uniref:SUEL-type lectin domain-containing protein n=1 Tax=Paralvinella palmiformis TaxID=53620 RepID=A0AAD9MWV3_9ANNE|nr:hypothetical protein LSH36_570g05002 [Paralvinella palmiformis]
MSSARYGRMSVGKCLSRQVGAMGCNTNVLSLLDQLCSGQHTCEVRVSSIIDAIPEERQPCSKDYRSYLEASYVCVPTITRPQDACIAQKEIEVTEKSGYLASIVTDETTCGSIDAPWILKMSKGQTIDLELYDFAVSTRDRDDFVDDVAGVCHVYAIIKEQEAQSSETICGSHVRRSIAFRSMGHVLEIRLVTKRKSAENGYFLLRYQDPVAPPYGWVQRNDNEALFGCNYTTHSWIATCNGDTWRGNSYNCTQGDALFAADVQVFTGTSPCRRNCMRHSIGIASPCPTELNPFRPWTVLDRRTTITGRGNCSGTRRAPATTQAPTAATARPWK